MWFGCGSSHVVATPTRSADEVESMAGNMLGASLITKQTGEEGKPCNRVLLTERVYMRRELYLSILMDRASDGPVIVASSKGGTSIEDIAEETPELIVTVSWVARNEHCVCCRSSRVRRVCPHRCSLPIAAVCCFLPGTC